MATVKARKPRKDALYTIQELQILSKYKTEYRQQTTRESRAQIIREKILVDLFNFWIEHGKGPVNGEESISRAKVRQHFTTF